MAKILGKVTASASFEIPRGADVSLRIAVPEAWLAEGRTIEVELPRNLLCARCSGGGCSACKNSGAITLRGRAELPEVVQVVLPLQRAPAAAGQCHSTSTGHAAELVSLTVATGSSCVRPVVIRIPECGGLPDASNGALVRGMLLLEVCISDTVSPNVRCCAEDEDPLSSAKMLRAEARAIKEQILVGDAIQPVIASRSIRAPSMHKEVLSVFEHGGTAEDDGGAPPSSRVGRVGAMAPPAVQHSSRVPRERKFLRYGASEPSDLPAPRHAVSPNEVESRAAAAVPMLYLGIAVLTALGVLALIFL